MSTCSACLRETTPPPRASSRVSPRGSSSKNLSKKSSKRLPPPRGDLPPKDDRPTPASAAWISQRCSTLWPSPGTTRLTVTTAGLIPHMSHILVAIFSCLLLPPTSRGLWVAHLVARFGWGRTTCSTRWHRKVFPCTFSILSFCEVGSLCVPYCPAGFLGCSFVPRVPVRFVPRFFEPPEPQLFDQDRGHDGRRDGQDAAQHAEGRGPETPRLCPEFYPSSPSLYTRTVAHRGMSSSRIVGAVLAVVRLGPTPLPVAVGGLAHRVLVFQRRSQGASHRRQRGREPREGQILAEADRVLEDGLEVGARHEHPRCEEDEREQCCVGQEHCQAYGQHGNPVVERGPLLLLPPLGSLPQMVGYDDPDDHRHYRRDHQQQQTPEAYGVRQDPESRDHQRVGPCGEGRSYGSLEGGKHPPGAVGQNHPRPESYAPERPRGSEAGVDVHRRHVLVWGIDPPEGAHDETGGPWTSLKGDIRFGLMHLLVELLGEPEGGFSGPRTQPQRAHGGQREAGHAALGADVGRDEPPAPVDRQVRQAEGQVPALAEHLLPALVQYLRRFPIGAGEGVDHYRHVPRDPPVDPAAEEIGQFGSQLLGDLLGDVGGGYQSQRYSAGHEHLLAVPVVTTSTTRVAGLN